MKNIIDKYNKLIKSIIVKFIGNGDEDLEQEVYVHVWKNLDSYKEKGKLRQWIGKITANICRDYLKSSKNKNNHSAISNDEYEYSNIPDKNNLEQSFEDKQKKMIIAKAVNNLKPRLADVIIMYEIDCLTYDEIAQKTNCSIGTVKSRLHTARQALYEELKDLMKEL